MPPWTVEYEGALGEWEARRHPDHDRLIAVLEWLLSMVDTGPPQDHMPVPLNEDLYVSWIPDPGIFVTYLALGYERRIVIRRFD